MTAEDDSRGLTVGAFQFAGTADVSNNLCAIERGVVAAAAGGVRLLVLQECALAGYPPVELQSVDDLDASLLRTAEHSIIALAAEHSMYIAYGTIETAGHGARNTVRVARPNGSRSPAYAKQALYGWDADNFVAGASSGPIHVVDGFRVGVRICWEVRFPELFRQLRELRVDIAIVPFCMFGVDELRRSVSEAQLVSRAAENCFHVVAANSCSHPQAAPTCVVDTEGRVLARTEWDSEAVAIATIRKTDPTFGQRGIIETAQTLGHHRTD